MAKRLGKLFQEQSIFFSCDIQTNFMNLIHNVDTVKHVGKQMAKASKILNIPVVVTEQYPKYFGPTIPEILEELEKPLLFEKMTFSMLTPQVKQELGQLKRKQAILYGLETHVCVLQTAIDLMENDYEVHLVCDGVSSQRQFDKSVALERMKQLGVFFTTFESCIFQIMGSAQHEKFKDISKLCNPKFSGERPDQGNLSI